MCLFTDLKAHLLSIRSWGCLLALLSYSEGLRHLRLAGYICWWHPRHCLQYRRDAFSASQQSTCLAHTALTACDTMHQRGCSLAPDHYALLSCRYVGRQQSVEEQVLFRKLAGWTAGGSLTTLPGSRAGVRLVSCCPSGSWAPGSLSSGWGAGGCATLAPPDDVAACAPGIAGWTCRLSGYAVWGTWPSAAAAADSPSSYPA